MKIGDEEVLSLREAGERLSVSPGTLLVQIRNGALVGQKIGKQWAVKASDLAAYDKRRKQPRGFARPDHPLHGKQGPGHRRKKTDE